MIYVASSWRNHRQPSVVRALRRVGYQVYDFRHPAPGLRGFHWSDIDPAWKDWTPEEFRTALQHQVARDGYERDLRALQASRATVLVLPCGRSAHLEAGYCAGAGSPLFLLLESGEPELMYAMAAHVACSVGELVAAIQGRLPASGPTEG